jgi:hypothetical protein
MKTKHSDEITGVSAQTNAFITHVDEVEAPQERRGYPCATGQRREPRCKLIPSARQGMPHRRIRPVAAVLSELFMVTPRLR